MSSTWPTSMFTSGPSSPHLTSKEVPGAVGIGGHALQLYPGHSAQDTDTWVLSPGSCLLRHYVGQSS